MRRGSISIALLVLLNYACGGGGGTGIGVFGGGLVDNLSITQKGQDRGAGIKDPDAAEARLCRCAQEEFDSGLAVVGEACAADQELPQAVVDEHLLGGGVVP